MHFEDSYSCSGHCLTANLTLQTTQIMCRQNPVRNRPVTPSHQSRSHGGWIYYRWLLNILSDIIYIFTRCYRSIPNGVLMAHDLGGLQCEVGS